MLCRSPEDLWKKAVNALNDEDKPAINFAHADKIAILDDTLKIVEEKKQLCLQKQWKFKRSDGRHIILRDLCEKVIVWVRKFKEIGDVAVQYDPIHTSLPWASIRSILQVGGFPCNTIDS